MKKCVVFAGVLGVLECIAGCAGEQPAVNVDPAIVDAIKARQANFREMGAASKNIGDALKAGAPIGPPIKMAAAQIENFAEQQQYWFPAGSGPETGVETAARAEIWAQPQQFREKQQALIEQAAKLTALARDEDRAAFAEQFRAVGQACKNCHDNFRVPED